MVKNTFWLTLAEVIARFFSLILVIYLARILGVTEYGKFTFALSFASLMSILADIGLIDIATREFSRNRENEKKFSSVFTLALVLSMFAYTATFVASFFITSDQNIRNIIWILMIFVLVGNLFGVFFSFLRARQKMEYESIVKISQATVTLALVLLVILYVPSVLAISYGYLFSVLITLTVFLLFFSYYINPIKIKFSKDIFAILQISWPLSFGFVPGWVYISINSIMLGYFGFIEENGWYGASMRIAVAAMIISHLLIKSFYPALSSFYVTSKEKLHKAWNYLAECMVFLVIPVVVGGVLLSEKIINTFYGQGFAPAIFALQLLMVVVGISFINYPYTIILIITDRQKHNFIVMCLGGALNIGLNMALIPWYGLYGAIFSTMLASLFVLGATVILSQKAALLIPLYKRFFITLAISLCCAGGMSAVIALMLQYSINVFIICFLGGCFYIVSFVLVSIWLKQVNLKALWKTL